MVERLWQLWLRRDPRLAQLRQWHTRYQWLKAQSKNPADWPEDEAIIRQALESAAFGNTGLAPALGANFEDLARAILPMDLQRALDREAPTKIQLPSGRQVFVLYPTNPNDQPQVSSRVQDFFGCRDHPCLGPKRVPLKIELLAPNSRPVQITSDLKAFWQSSYPEVRKTLRGRYPKHAWPEDPLSHPQKE